MPTTTAHRATRGHVRKHLQGAAPQNAVFRLGPGLVAGLLVVGPRTVNVNDTPTCVTLQQYLRPPRALSVNCISVKKFPIRC